MPPTTPGTPTERLWPAERGLPVAGYLPQLALADLLLGGALGLVLAAALWWTGHPVIGAALVLLTVAAVSVGSYQTVEETWVGDDWLSNRFLGRPVVLDADDVVRIDLPCSSVGLDYLVFRGAGRTARVDLGELFRRDALGRAVLALSERAVRAGAEITPGASDVLASLRRHLD